MSNARVNEAEARARAAEAEAARLRAELRPDLGIDPSGGAEGGMYTREDLIREVERLRGLNRLAKAAHQHDLEVREEQRAEVERLRAEREEMIALIRQNDMTLADLDDEVRRLRAKGPVCTLAGLHSQVEELLADRDHLHAKVKRLRHDLEVAENDLMFSHEASASYREEVAGLRRQLKVAHAASIRRGQEIERLRFPNEP